MISLAKRRLAEFLRPEKNLGELANGQVRIRLDGNWLTFGSRLIGMIISAMSARLVIS